MAIGRRDLAGTVYDLFVQLCPTVFPVTLADTDRARSLVLEAAGVDVRDAIHAAVMINHDVARIASFDRGFDRLDGITRVDLL